VAYTGAIYARSKCKISGNAVFSGQLMCYNEPDGAGDINLADENLVSGNPTFIYNCGGVLSAGARVVNWSRRF
jgi:hypothetical protein